MCAALHKHREGLDLGEAPWCRDWAIRDPMCDLYPVILGKHLTLLGHHLQGQDTDSYPGVSRAK